MEIGVRPPSQHLQNARIPFAGQWLPAFRPG